MSNGTEARLALRACGDRLEASDIEHAAAMTEVSEWFEIALDNCLPIAEIARLTGLNRQIIFNIVYPRNFKEKV
jgi:hypothetical protein